MAVGSPLTRNRRNPSAESYCRKSCCVALFRDLVVAGLTACVAVVKTIHAETHVKLSLAEDTILLALTAMLGLLALTAQHPHFGAHAATVILRRLGANVSLVTRLQARAARSLKPEA